MMKIRHQSAFVTSKRHLEAHRCCCAALPVALWQKRNDQHDVLWNAASQDCSSCSECSAQVFFFSMFSVFSLWLVSIQHLIPRCLDFFDFMKVWQIYCSSWGWRDVSFFRTYHFSVIFLYLVYLSSFCLFSIFSFEMFLFFCFCCCCQCDFSQLQIIVRNYYHLYLKFNCSGRIKYG